MNVENRAFGIDVSLEFLYIRLEEILFFVYSGTFNGNYNGYHDLSTFEQ